MTDERSDVDFVRSERQREADKMKRLAEARALTGERLGVKRGRLTVEEAAERRRDQGEAEEVGTLEARSVEIAPAERRTEDPVAALRYARLGFFAALTLVLMFFWIRQRRNA